MNVDKTLVEKLLKTIDAGLSMGLGYPHPGGMCVQAAVTYSTGEDFSDSPQCVTSAIRNRLIGLNDMPWSSSEARARGLRKVAVAQLGTVDWSSAVKRAARQEMDNADRRFMTRTGRHNLVPGTPQYDAELIALADEYLEILKKHKSPGCAFLYMADPAEEPPKLEQKPNVFSKIAVDKRELVPVR